MNDLNNKLSSSQVKWLTYLVYILISVVTISNGWLVAKAFDLEERKVNHTEFDERHKGLSFELKEQRDMIRNKIDELKDLIFDLHMDKDNK